MFAIAVHGGAGTWEPDFHGAGLAGVRRAAQAGAEMLARGSSALEAAVAAAVVLEDDPVFNAGTGSTLNLRGEVECDAAVMDGAALSGAGVASVRGVKNPVLLARRVLEETDHVLLAGAGAEELARAWGLANGNAPTAARLAKWEKARAALPEEATKLAALLKAHPELAGERRGTIGAVARDSAGRCAVASSTGGVLLKLPGRIGDTPVLGAGSYASPAGAVAATGQGELMLRCLTAKLACERMAAGDDASAAVRAALQRTALEAGSDLGLIGVDANGGVGIVHATPLMPHAFLIEGRELVARLGADQPP